MFTRVIPYSFKGVFILASLGIGAVFTRANQSWTLNNHMERLTHAITNWDYCITRWLHCTELDELRYRWQLDQPSLRKIQFQLKRFMVLNGLNAVSCVPKNRKVKTNGIILGSRQTYSWGKPGLILILYII